MSELAEHLDAIGAIPWTGLQGTGQISYGTQNSTSYSATLSILGSDRFRLDGQTDKSDLSIRIHGRHGAIQEQDGIVTPILPSTAVSGIFQFELPRLAASVSSPYSWGDRGSVTSDGEALRRLTLSIPSRPDPGATATGTVETIDFYFDPATHLLLKTASSIQVNGAGNNPFLRVVTYGDYRRIGSSLIPFRYTQTLDGQLQWTLQLTEVRLSPELPDTYFEF